MIFTVAVLSLVTSFAHAEKLPSCPNGYSPTYSVGYTCEKEDSIKMESFDDDANVRIKSNISLHSSSGFLLAGWIRAVTKANSIDLNSFKYSDSSKKKADINFVMHTASSTITASCKNLPMIFTNLSMKVTFEDSRCSFSDESKKPVDTSVFAGARVYNTEDYWTIRRTTDDLSYNEMSYWSDVAAGKAL